MTLKENAFTLESQMIQIQSLLLSLLHPSGLEVELKRKINFSSSIKFFFF